MPLPDVTQQLSLDVSTAEVGTSMAPLNPSENDTSSGGEQLTGVAVSDNSVDVIPAGIGRETCPICIVVRYFRWRVDMPMHFTRRTLDRGMTFVSCLGMVPIAFIRAALTRGSLS